MSIPSRSEREEGMVTVQLPSSAVFPVHVSEVTYFEERAREYLSQNHFPNVSDLQDLDRLLVLELMLHRWNTWLSSNRDYWGNAIDANETGKQIKDWSVEARQLKKSLGMDKVTRDKQKGDDSVSAFISNLLHRAREFGINRERQLDKALELFNQMDAIITLHLNSDETERREQHVTEADVMEWLVEIAIPEFREIDAYFRKHVQGMWIRDM